MGPDALRSDAAAGGRDPFELTAVGTAPREQAYGVHEDKVTQAVPSLTC